MNRITRTTFIFCVISIIMPFAAGATQGHIGVEGLYIHQIAHLFFCFSMGILIYWLKAHGLTREAGWRFIGYAALLFLVWSLDAFIAHLLDEQLGIVQVERIGSWDIQLDAEGFDSRFGLFYYCAKLDHLFCVPGMILFYLGLRRLSLRAIAEATPPKLKDGAE